MIKKINLTEKKILLLLICLLVGLIITTKLIYYWKDAMKPAVVFLVPEAFIGPVFVVFSQANGQDLKLDPLGVSLTVPENGLIKVKASRNEVLTKSMNFTKRNVYWITVNNAGQRSNMPYQGGGGRDYDKEVDWTWYIDTQNQAKQMIFDEKLYPKTNDAEFYFLTKAQVKLKTVYSWNTCRADIWTSVTELEDSRKNWYFGKEEVKPSSTFSCMQFNVSYQKMDEKELTYENFLGDYSVPELENKLNEIIPLRQKYLKEYLEQNKED